MKILMVCLGNICRSPMAEGLMQKKIKENKLNAMVDSAGTSGLHAGEAPDPRMMETASRNNVSINNLRGRQFSAADFKKFDRIFVMDKSNYKNVVKLAQSKEDIAKVEMILNLLHPGKNAEVPDPYFGGDEGFQKVFNMLDEATNTLLKELSEND